jgi:hypothetical protein
METIKEITMVDRSDDDWAMVELFRWQYGALPTNDDYNKKLDISVGLRNMAEAIRHGSETRNYDKLPTILSVALVLKYCAKKLETK